STIRLRRVLGTSEIRFQSSIRRKWRLSQLIPISCQPCRRRRLLHEGKTRTEIRLLRQPHSAHCGRDRVGSRPRESSGRTSGLFTKSPSQELAAIPRGIEGRHFRYETYGFYGQDDWRATSRLTLNLGLRYEFNTTVNE